MMNTMYTTGGPSVGIFFFLHMLASLAFSVGILFLLVLAVKTLTNTQLKKWGMWLAIGGAIVCLLTMGMLGTTGRGYRMKAPVGSVMEMPMMDFDEDDEGDASGMMGSMKGMTMMLQGKTGDEFDKAFIQMMIPHHQSAIDMANLAQANAKHQEIKNMAAAIISAQQGEINEMQQWMKDWGYAK